MNIFQVQPGYNMRLRTAPSVSAPLSGAVLKSGDVFQVLAVINDDADQQTFLKVSESNGRHGEGWAFVYHPQTRYAVCVPATTEAATSPEGATRRKSRRQSRRESRRLSLLPIPPALPMKGLLEGYILKELIGEGGFSEVYRGETVPGASGGSGGAYESVAVKVVDKEKLRPHDEESLRREVSILTTLRHPGILRLISHVEVGSFHFLVSDIFFGGDLFDRIVERGSYSEDEVRAVVRQLLSILSYLHGPEAQIVHRDVKPENLLLRGEADHVTIVLADFGFAVSVDELSTDQTAADFRYGTVDYMSPELLPPDEPHYSSAGDVWAAGVVAFVAFAGCQPFHFPSDGEEALTNDGMDYLFGSGAGGAPEDEVISRRIRTEEVSFDSSDWEMASDDMKDFVKLVLTKDRRCRPSAVELLDHRWIRDESQILPKGEWEVGLLKRKSETETAIPRLSFTFVRDEPIGLNLRPGSLVVDSISPLTQAEEAGVKAGSIIVEVNWRSCTSVAEYIQLRALDPKAMQISVQETEVVEEAPSNADEVNITVLASSDGKEQTSPPPSAQIHVDRLEGADEDGDRMQIEAGQQGASPTPAQDDKSTRFKEDKRDGLGGSYSVIDETSTDDGQEESEDVPTAVEPAKCEQHTLAQGGMEAVVETTKLARPEARKEALRKAAHVQQEVSRVLALVQDLVRQADAIVTATGPLTAADARGQAVLLYQDAIDAVLGLRSMAPELFVEGSELMKLAEQLLHQAESLPTPDDEPGESEKAPGSSTAVQEEQTVAHELRLFYDLHTIPESESFREVDGENEDENEDDEDDGSPLPAQHRSSRESHEVLHPDAPGSARGSYDSDDYAVLLGLSSSSLPRRISAEPPVPPRRSSAEVSLANVVDEKESASLEKTPKNEFHTALVPKRSKLNTSGGNGRARDGRGRGRGRGRQGRNFESNGETAAAPAPQSLISENVDALVPGNDEAAEAVAAAKAAEKKLAELQELILLSHEAAATGGGNADSVLRNLAAVSLGHRRASSFKDEVDGEGEGEGEDEYVEDDLKDIISGADKPAAVSQPCFDDEMADASGDLSDGTKVDTDPTIAILEIEEVATNDSPAVTSEAGEAANVHEADAILSAAVKEQHLKTIAVLEGDHERRLRAIKAEQAQLEVIKASVRVNEQDDRHSLASTTLGPQGAQASLTARLFPKLDVSNAPRSILRSKNASLAAQEKERRGEQIRVAIVVCGVSQPAHYCFCTPDKTVASVLDEAIGASARCLEGVSLDGAGIKSVRTRFGRDALPMSLPLCDCSLDSEDAGSASGAMSEWEVFENHDAFPGDNALSRPFTKLEDAQRLCTSRCFGGFVVYRQTAYFRRQKRVELIEKKRRQKESVLYIAPLQTKKQQRAKKSSAPTNAARSEMGGLPQTVTLIVTPNETSLPAINAGSVSRKHPLRITLAVTTHLEQPTLSRKSSSAVKRQNIASPPVKAFATWWWAAEGEVGFSALYQPSALGASGRSSVPQRIVVPYSQAKDGQGEWEVPGDGTITFEFENSGTIRGKKVQYACASHLLSFTERDDLGEYDRKGGKMAMEEEAQTTKSAGSIASYQINE